MITKQLGKKGLNINLNGQKCCGQAFNDGVCLLCCIDFLAVRAFACFGILE